MEEVIGAPSARQPAVPRGVAPAVAVVVIAVVLATGHAWAAGAFSVLALLALLVMLGVSLVLGVELSLALKLDDAGELDLIPSLLLGMVALSSGLLLLGVTTPLSVSGNLLLVALVGGAGVYFHRSRWEGVGPGVEQGRVRIVLDRPGQYALAAILIASAGWSIENLQGMFQAAPGIYESHPWQDIFGHATNVSRFMNPGGAPSLGNEQFAGMPLPPYHYASYMLPAFVGRVGGLQAYALTASLLPMLGMVWSGMAAYAFGRAVGNTRIGALAALGVTLVPDPSCLGLGHTWTSYFFFQQVGMGGLYAVSTMGLAAALGFRAMQQGAWRPLAGAALLIAVTALYKMQVVLAFGLPLAVLLVAFQRGWSWRARLACIALMVLGYGAALVVARHVPHAPTLVFSTEGAMPNISTMLGIVPRFLSTPFRPLLTEDAPYARTAAIGAIVILVKIYGFWLVALMAGARLARRSGPNAGFDGDPVASLWRWRFLVALAVSSVVVHLVVALGVGPNLSGRGDLYEVIHKSFVWPYFAVAVCSCALLGLWLERAMAAWPARRLAAVAGLALLAGAAVVAVLGQRTQTRSATSAAPMRMQMRADYVAAAEYLRTHTAPDAVVQYFDNDPIKVFTALTERKSFVIMCEVNCGTDVPLATHRFKLLDAALAQSDVRAVRAATRALGIDWLVIARGDRAWQARPDAVPDARFGELELYSTATSTAPAPRP